MTVRPSSFGPSSSLSERVSADKICLPSSDESFVRRRLVNNKKLKKNVIRRNTEVRLVGQRS